MLIRALRAATFSVLALLASGATPPPGSEGDEALAEPRRVVTADAADGHAVVLVDGASPNARVLNGSRITRLWETGPLPVSLAVTKDVGVTAGNAYREGFTGTSLYVADIPPGLRIDLHRQDSLDYIAVLTGEVDLLMEKGPLRLHQGDVLVQAGNLHGWPTPRRIHHASSWWC